MAERLAAAQRFEQEERGLQTATTVYAGKLARGELPGSLAVYGGCAAAPLLGTVLLARGRGHSRGLRMAGAGALLLLGVQIAADRFRADLRRLHGEDAFLRRQLGAAVDLQHVYGAKTVPRGRFE